MALLLLRSPYLHQSKTPYLFFALSLPSLYAHGYHNPEGNKRVPFRWRKLIIIFLSLTFPIMWTQNSWEKRKRANLAPLLNQQTSIGVFPACLSSLVLSCSLFLFWFFNWRCFVYWPRLFFHSFMFIRNLFDLPSNHDLCLPQLCFVSSLPCLSSKFISSVHFALFQSGVDRSIEVNVLHPFARPSFCCLHFAISVQLSSGRVDGRKKNQTMKLQGNSTSEV